MMTRKRFHTTVRWHWKPRYRRWMWHIGSLGGNTTDVGIWRGFIFQWGPFVYERRTLDRDLTAAHDAMNEATSRYRQLAGLEA
jgi:hypothetical protein